MNIKKISIYILSFMLLLGVFTFVSQSAHAQNCTGMTAANTPVCESVDVGDLGFKIPSLGDLLTFAIRAFFVIAGLAALFYMLLGAFAWVTSGGDKDAVSAAQQKIQAAVVGMIIIVAVLAIIWTLEQVIFNRRICLGLSCPVTLPGLVETSTNSQFCCTCVNRATGAKGSVINAFTHKCTDTGGSVSQ